ncbi:TPA: hypothetical protein HA239_00545 [Candidatus Woesearchaeota archaeon]|nr:hypothetical protein QT06_C0001G1202 [archaeon GW2011_AR15]MBS3104328.1 hypothetical protein [Candidatus Woesearchaeota archaeon]HIH40888.1 hypothetical protein [Candidatus Woesearchaeota archaeon]
MSEEGLTIDKLYEIYSPEIAEGVEMLVDSGYFYLGESLPLLTRTGLIRLMDAAVQLGKTSMSSKDSRAGLYKQALEMGNFYEILEVSDSNMELMVNALEHVIDNYPEGGYEIPSQ